MKKFCKAVIIILIIGIGFAGIANAQTLTFACENKQDFPTIMGNTQNIEAEKPGIGVEAIRMLEQKLGIKIEIKRLPWKRCLYEMDKGKVDGVFTASYKDKRKQFGRYPEKDGKVDPSRRFTSASYAFYKLKSADLDFSNKDYGIFTGKIGGPLGYSIIDDLKKQGLTMDESPSTENDLKKLVAGRLQAVAALEMTGDFYLMANKGFEEKIEKMSPLIVEKPYYFMVSHQLYKKDAALAEKIFDTIAQIREDPNFKKKLADYLK
ncbi:MAG: transporter substrate-binding domain-containing protein [Thermodesulfobacteriota bacterium]|nr:transporter substrate-binding domain-containing protein [Thermodesulfobacteriota bacterium]